MKKPRKILALALSLSMLFSAGLPLTAGAEQSVSASDTLNHGVYAEFYEMQPYAPYELITSDLKATGFSANIHFNELRAVGQEKVGRDTYFGIRFRFYIVPTESGYYAFQPNADDFVRLWIDGHQVINGGWANGYNPDRWSEEIYLEAGQRYEIQLDYGQEGDNANLALNWSKDGGRKTLVPAEVLYLPEGMGPVDIPEPPDYPNPGVPTLYAVANAHLDTVWNWDYEETIRDCIPNTFNGNFELLDKYPDYTFNFEGATRYALLEEYYPETFEKLQKYIDEGRWFTAGSAWENGDVNGPSPEALIRNILIGNQYFADKFGNENRSRDVFLPDCFGFSYALPSLASHCNLTSFSTQKLGWGSSFPNNVFPFDVGRWIGPDGSYIMASLDSNYYGADLADSAPNGIRNWDMPMNKLNNNTANFGFNFTTFYYGKAGDHGGAPDEKSVAQLQKDVDLNATEEIQVISARSDQWARDLSEEQKLAMPSYDGEMVMREHGVGSYTSRAIGHRWNSRNELLGVAAEKSAVAASWLGAEEYPADTFNDAWKRVINHQFHDDITGTSVLPVYRRGWNDYMLSLNQFGNEYENAVGGVVSAMDTSAVEGTALVVNNPVALDRNDTVEATVTMDEDCEFVRVYNDKGEEVPSQILSKDGNVFEIAFTAEVPSMGYRVFDVRPADSACGIDTGLSITSDGLSNEKYDVAIDENGDISNIFDKTIEKELLSEPIRLGLLDDTETEWPAWELKISDYWDKEAREYVADTASQIEIVENGPARVALKITRQYGNSTYEQTVSLDAGGEAVEVQNNVEWDERSTMLKATFKLNSANETATYDLGLGAIERGNNTEWKAEVPAQKWADMTAEDGSFGVSILSDSKNGWDKPFDDTLRLTLIHTPTGNYDAYGGDHAQDRMEVGENRFGYAIYGHAGTYGEADTQQQAQLFTEPMVAFQTVKHEGSLGSNYSFASVSNDDVIVRAVKAGETGEGLENKGDEIIVRFNEGANKQQSGVEFSIGNGIESVREVYGSEESMPEDVSAENGAYELKDGKLVFDMKPYGIRSFAIKLKDSDVIAPENESASVALPYNEDGFSNNADKADATLGDTNIGLPSEMVPSVVTAAGVDFLMGNKADRANNVVVSNGQNVNLPSGNYNKVYLMAFSLNGDKEATFNVGDRTQTLSSQTIRIADYHEHVAEWDQAGPTLSHGGYIKEDDVAYVATHHHENGADQIASQIYMFKYELEIPEGATLIQLPEDEDIVILSATAVNETYDGQMVTEMYDSRERGDEPAMPDREFTDYSGFEANDPVSNVNMNGQNGGTNNATFESGTTDAMAHTGNNSHKLTVNVGSDGGAYAYTSIYTTNIQVTEDMYIEYWLYAEDEDALSMNIDMKMASRGALRDINNDGDYVRDTRGVQVHPMHHPEDPPVEGAEKAEVGKWQYFRVDIGKWVAGNTIDDIMFGFDFRNAHKGSHTAYIDDLRIGHSNEDAVAPNKDQLISMIELAQSIEDLYTPESTANLNAALDAAILVRDDAAATQEQIDQAVSDLNAAYTALELDPAKSDKSVLLAALDEAKSIDKSRYTEDSYNALLSAIAAGEEIYNGLYYQDQIDQATADIYAAIDDLVERFSITSDKTSYAVNESILLTAVTPVSTQEIRITNERGKPLGMSAFGYEMVDGLKVWTIKTSLGTAGNRSIYLDVKEDGQWVSTNVGIDVLVDSAPIADVRPSLTMATVDKSMVDPYEIFTITAITSTAIDRMSLTNENGNAIGLISKDYTDDGFVRTWKLRASLGSSGNRTLTVKAGSGSEWLDKTVDVNITVGTPAPEAPPVSNDAHVMSLDFSSDSAAANQVFHGTAVTTTGVNKIALLNELGRGITLSNVTYSDSGDVRTWDFDLSVGSAGSRMFDLIGYSDGQALDTTVNCSINITAE